MADRDKKVKARDGQTLCQIAINKGGFLNCDPLRAHADNAGHLVATLSKGTLVTVPPKEVKKEGGKGVKKKHVFKKKMAPPPSIRFVHGSRSQPWSDDETLQYLGISNHPSDKGGRYPTTSAGPVAYATMPAFPTTFGFSNDGHFDKDTFKIEVVDPKFGGNILKVTLTALKPVYVGGKLDHHVPFAAGDPNQAARSVTVDCQRVAGGKKRFRSRYVRLVTNIRDFNAINANSQALLVGPISDGNAGANDDVEVLDMHVRADYELSFCTSGSGPKCVMTRELPVGRPGRKRRVKTVVHVLRNGRNLPGVITLQQARQGIGNFVREIYAQADLSFKYIAPSVQLIQPPANMIVIDNRQARRAEGGKTITIRVRVDAAIDQNISVTTKAGNTPTQTAIRLARAIRKQTGVAARASRNPPINGRPRGSGDVLVGNPQTQNVRLNVVTSADARHPAVIASITSTTITEFGGDDGHVGTMDERVLVKNYDTGSRNLDTFLVGALHQGSFGEAFTPSRNRVKNRRPRHFLVNTVILQASTQVGLTTAHTTVPHEWAHVLMDAVHIKNPPTELLFVGSPVGSNEQVVNAPRRIGDPPSGKSFRVEWDENIKGNPVKRLRTKNPRLLTSW